MNNHNTLQKLRVGKQYMFSFTHRKGGLGIVCEVDITHNAFVVYDVATKGYERIPLRRLKACENV